jgi:negative regulator of sigma-B (phosphoserine phosphatase)
MELITPGVGPSIDWGVAGRPLAGEERSGDLHVVKQFDDGVLAAVIDGLGHGDGAADVAASAGEILDRYAAEPLEQLAARCHDGLRHTRGAVMGLARFAHDGSMTWLAVGDAEGVIVPDGAEETGIRTLPQHRGIVGLNLPVLHAESVDLSPGDAVIMSTDGVDPRGLRRGLLRFTPQWLATDILGRSARANDDALVLVIRYRGSA